MTADTVARMPRAALLTLAEVADLIQKLNGTDRPTVDTLRTLHKRAQKRRAAGAGKATDLPAPDRVVGGRPAWYESTIRRWWDKEKS